MNDPILAALVAIRWVHFAAMFAVFGGAVFWLGVGRRQLDELRTSTARTAFVVETAAWIAAASGAGWLAATLLNMTGGHVDWETVRAFFLESPFGPVEIARLGLLIMLVAVARRRARAPIAVVAALLLVSQAWLGHAAEGRTPLLQAVMVTVYAVHVLAAAAWLGGLVPLALGLRECRASPDTSAPARRLLARFSWVAQILVALMLATGVANTFFHADGHLLALDKSTWGAVLLVKLAMVGAMLAIAGATRFVTMPRMARHGPSAAGRAVTIEVALGLGVLAAAALLGVTPPPA